MPKQKRPTKRQLQEARLEAAIASTREYLERNGDYDEDNPVTDDDALESLMSDCGQMRDGTCLKAGSEECDWECPFS